MNTMNLNINGKEYRLKLTTRGMVELEGRLGVNPLAIFGEDRLPKIGDMMLIFHAALQPYNHGISLNDAYSLFDAFLDEGKTLMDFVNVLMDIFRVSGLIGNVEEDEAKN